MDLNVLIVCDVCDIVQCLIVKVDVVEIVLVQEYGVQLVYFVWDFQWEVNVILFEQVNVFCLFGGKMVVYIGLVLVVCMCDVMVVVMGYEIVYVLLCYGVQWMVQQKLIQIGQMVGVVSGMDVQQ